MKDAGKRHKPNGKPSQEKRSDRKSATGMNGSPKKGGYGGKFTWIGGVGHAYTTADVAAAVDAKDPDFEDPADQIAIVAAN
ncbi:hypothetical protein RIF29_40319 [Crotalaria pallida]|uniref:Uncharacterized protein n=1 Tax=Crotalaria pallida TaxID=3830 RepID=A0AAN9E2Y5_CROPI